MKFAANTKGLGVYDFIPTNPRLNENNNPPYIGFSLLDDKDLEREAKLNKYDCNKLFFKKIKTEIFDKEFTIKNKLIFIKIDVERHEFQVLLGAINFLTKSNNKIFLQIEIVDHLKNKVLKLLKNYSFNLIGSIDKGGHDYYLSNYDI